MVVERKGLRTRELLLERSGHQVKTVSRHYCMTRSNGRLVFRTFRMVLSFVALSSSRVLEVVFDDWWKSYSRKM